MSPVDRVIRVPMRYRFAAVVTRVARQAMLAATLAIVAGVAPVGAQSGIEGKWLGQIGSPKERIETGLEFRRAADGKLMVRMTQPILNVYDAEVGEATLDGNHVTQENLALDLTLAGDRLTGFFPGPNSPADLRRAKSLPVEKPLPKLPTGPAPRWQARLGGTVYATPAVHDGVAYIGTTGGVFNAIKTADGSTAWAQGIGAPIYGTATVAGDGVYFVCDDGYLYKLALSDGARQWRYALGDADVGRVIAHPSVFSWDWQAPQPAFADDTVYVGSGDGTFHAVDAKSGERRWRFASGAKIRNGAAVDGDRVFFGSEDANVYALDRATGRELWRTPTRAPIDASPIVHQGRVLIGNRGAGLYSLDVATGKEAWRLYFWGSWVESTAVVHDGTIYIGSSDLRRVSAIDPATGNVRWRSDVYGWTWGTPLVIGDRLYVGASGGTPYVIRHDGGFLVLDRASGRVLSRWPLPDTGGHQWGVAGSPVAAGEDVLVATIAGSLLAFPRH